ncbi:hypothetical protein CAEBREN_05727 [Caenorhabditis brenneri]|uniref:Uncharacterized protein n=1 Tax=Caenorhabditis brenneri TaxID=135651 RepID=G0N149_CAEBE|nr:hypothetical protein CAEBREN_05727 [Caenorhabditis brenneri]
MGLIDFQVTYAADDENSALSIHSVLIGFCHSAQVIQDCLKFFKKKLEANCKHDVGAGVDCIGIVKKGTDLFCQTTQGFPGCPANPPPDDSITSILPETTTTTSPPATDPPFSTGVLLGGLIAGLLFSILLTLVFFCFCRKKSYPDDGLSTAEDGRGKKKKKNKKKKHTTGTTTGSSGGTGTTATTSGTTATTATKKKKKAKKAKKGKKGKKGSKTSAETNTASAF